MTEISFAIFVISMVAVCGLLVGGIRHRGIGLGAAGVLFIAILVGYLLHAGELNLPHEIIHFAKDFGLLLFVFTMGIELGPGIVRLWKRQGVLLNGLAALIVIFGAALSWGLGLLLQLPSVSYAGLFCGATTNTPALGAAEQAVEAANHGQNGNAKMLATMYAVAYPGGVVGIIASMLILKRLYKVNAADEAKQLLEAELADFEPLERRCVLIDNPHLKGVAFGALPGVEETGVRISRILAQHAHEVALATDQTLLHPGDVIQIVGPRSGLERFIPFVGVATTDDLMKHNGHVEFRRIYVTQPSVLNLSLRELALEQRYNVSVTRVERSGIEMAARTSTHLHFGDLVQVVGSVESLNHVSKYLGNSTDSLRKTPFIPLFLGIATGVVVGSVPLVLPGFHSPIKLGLAGGPLLVGIGLSLLGSFGKLVWYIPTPANHALRELGIILFLACAGLAAGPTFFAAAISFNGLLWMLSGLVITAVPLLAVGVIARSWLKQNFCTLCGLLAGSMTDPPALAFAGTLTQSEACSKSYAAVYPTTMILRIVAAQLLVMTK